MTTETKRNNSSSGVSYDQLQFENVQARNEIIRKNEIIKEFQ